MAFAAARMIRDNQNKERKPSSSDLPIPARGGSQVSNRYMFQICVYPQNIYIIVTELIKMYHCIPKDAMYQQRIGRYSVIMR